MNAECGSSLHTPELYFKGQAFFSLQFLRKIIFKLCQASTNCQHQNTGSAQACLYNRQHQPPWSWVAWCTEPMNYKSKGKIVCCFSWVDSEQDTGGLREDEHWCFQSGSPPSHCWFSGTTCFPAPLSVCLQWCPSQNAARCLKITLAARNCHKFGLRFFGLCIHAAGIWLEGSHCSLHEEILI